MTNGNGNGRQSVGLIAAHVLIAALIIVAVTVLVAIGKLHQESAVTLFGAAIGLTGGAAGAIVTSRYGLTPGTRVITPAHDAKTITTTVTEPHHIETEVD